MKVSTKFFNQSQLDVFGSMNKEIQNVQERIASGKNIVRASDDPVAAVKLSAAKEHRNLLERFDKNVDAAHRRLALADNALDQAVTTITRIGELTVQAANDTNGAGERTAIAMEVQELIKHMVELANTRDAQGQSVFSGYKTNAKAYEMTQDGEISYNGDRGQTFLQISENMKVANGMDGETVFGRVQTGGGPKSIFSILQGVAESIVQASSLSGQGSARGTAELAFSLPRDPVTFTFNLTGADGTAAIEASLAEGKYTDFIDQVNAQTHLTGVTASLDAVTGRVQLVDSANDVIVLNDLQIEGIETSSDEMTAYVDFYSIDGEGNEIGFARRLTDEDLLLSNISTDINDAINHLSNQQAYLGAQMNKADQQKDVIAQRKIAVSEEVSELGDADLTELVTKLQSLLLSRDASQQTFAKIGQQSLFDFIR